MLVLLSVGNASMFPFLVESSSPACIFRSSMNTIVFWSKTSICLVCQILVARTDALLFWRHYMLVRSHHYHRSNQGARLRSQWCRRSSRLLSLSLLPFISLPWRHFYLSLQARLGSYLPQINSGVNIGFIASLLTISRGIFRSLISRAFLSFPLFRFLEGMTAFNKSVSLVSCPQLAARHWLPLAACYCRHATTQTPVSCCFSPFVKSPKSLCTRSRATKKQKA